MITINLIPANLRKTTSAQAGFLQAIDLPKEILFGLGTLSISLLILLHLFLIGTYVVKLAQQMMYKATWEGMLPAKNTVDSISQELKSLRSKLSTINDITSKNAILWSQKLNILSDVVPKGVWFKKIVWDNKALMIEGSAFSKLHDEIPIVGSFVSILKKEENFVKDFLSVELNSVSRSKKGAVEVVDFKITAKVEAVEIKTTAKVK